MQDLDRPALLAFSPVPQEGQERRFPTLRDALAHATSPAGRAAPWIVTWSGEILSPRGVAALRERLEEARAPEAAR
jgi:hypothetical protein